VPRAAKSPPFPLLLIVFAGDGRYNPVESCVAGLLDILSQLRQQQEAFRHGGDGQDRIILKADRA
jgi:hypothetical protein